MAAKGLKWVFERGRSAMKTYGILLLLLSDVFLGSAHGYLSSAHVGQEPAYTPQHNPAMSGPALSAPTSESTDVTDSYIAKCPSGGACSKLPADCFACDYHHNCSYGKPANFTCKVKDRVQCADMSERKFNLTVDCQFCWQLDPSKYRCNISTACMTVSCPRKRYNTTCKVLDHVNCIGKREFQKRLFCNWTGGYKWSTALTLSITLGGFGADRFYLGQWREGLGKLFSFGGLGIWTLIDVLLIAVGYVGPADGSLYI
ncbi:TM2 domain-containing protein 3 isoform X1 [Pygocentrus nattereri]|uniref:TM2 domain-containing protein 3 n=1 Tax=Pygocentrus nattereri TaxID=42514 RepID=A0AAR2LHF2_PYGNA|nr:TM2 domain-containing protein 3 isoform X1 [Pygocentrus nattereri]